MNRPGLTYTDAVAAVEEALTANHDDDAYPYIAIRSIDAKRDTITGRTLTDVMKSFPHVHQEIEIEARLIVYPPREQRVPSPIVGRPTPAEPVVGEIRWGGTFSVDVEMPGGHLSPVRAAEVVNEVVWKLAHSTNFDEANATAFWSELRRLLAVDPRNSS